MIRKCDKIKKSTLIQNLTTTNSVSSIHCHQRTIYTGDKSTVTKEAFILVKNHLKLRQAPPGNESHGRGWADISIPTIYVILALNPLNQSDSHRFNKHRDIYNLLQHTKLLQLDIELQMHVYDEQMFHTDKDEEDNKEYGNFGLKDTLTS